MKKEISPDPLLVVGGAGYIGAHLLRSLTAAGRQAIVLDDLSGGHREAVGDVELIVGNLGDAALLDALFGARRIGAVLHVASFIEVGESVRDPAKYYDNNVARTITLLNAMVRHGVPRFLFSSTAAIFGQPGYLPLDEAHPACPISPYGRGKWMIEELLHDYHIAYGLQYGCLRYFNAAGAHPDGTIGEAHEPESHLIPRVLRVAAGRDNAIAINGEDYDTPDGTCVRDYIHVMDLAEAHLALLERLEGGLSSVRLNLGSGRGYSVREVIETARKITGKKIPVTVGPRRTGDPAILTADGTRAAQELGWTPTRSDLETILTDAWRWEQRRR